MTAEQIIAWGTVVGSLFTAASVWFAIIIYRREQDKLLFSSLRTSLIDIQTGISQLDSLMSERRFVEIGDCIASEIRRIIGPNANRSAIVSFLEENKNHDLIATAILMGLNHSETARSIEEIGWSLTRRPYQGANQIPLLREVLSGCVSYAIQASQGSTHPALFDSVLGNSEGRKQVVLPAIGDEESTGLVYEKIGLVVSGASAAALRQHGQTVVNNVHRIIGVITHRISALRDSDLRRLRRNLSGIVIQDPKDTTMIEDMLVRLDRMRYLFSDSEWDSLVECKTRILAVTEKDPE